MCGRILSTVHPSRKRNGWTPLSHLTPASGLEAITVWPIR